MPCPKTTREPSTRIGKLTPDAERPFSQYIPQSGVKPVQTGGRAVRSAAASDYTNKPQLIPSVPQNHGGQSFVVGTGFHSLDHILDAHVHLSLNQA